MAVTLATTRFRGGNRGQGTFASPEEIEIDNAPDGTVPVQVTNRGAEAFFVRLDDGATTTPFVRVAPKDTAYLTLVTTNATNLQFARQNNVTPRFISFSQRNQAARRGITNSAPFLADVIPLSLTGGGSGATTSPDCCTTTTDDIEITDPNSGLILRSANGKRWRVGVANTGALTTTDI